MGKDRNGAVNDNNGSVRRGPKRQGSTELYDMSTKVRNDGQIVQLRCTGYTNVQPCVGKISMIY